MKILMLLLVCLLTGGCHSQKNPEGQEALRADSVFFVEGTKKLYSADGYHPSSYVRYIERDGKAYLVQGCEGRKTIRVYDYASGKQLSEVEVDAGEGEFFAYSADTAFVIGTSKGKASLYAWTQGETVRLDIPVRVKKGHIEQFPRCWYGGAVPVEVEFEMGNHLLPVEASVNNELYNQSLNSSYIFELNANGTDDFIYMSFFYLKKHYRVIYDIDDDKFYTVFVGREPEGIVNDLDGRASFWPMWFASDKMIGVVSSDALEMEYDNPILLVVHK